MSDGSLDPALRRPGGRDRAARVLAHALLAAFVLQAALFALVLWRTMILRPFSDLLGWIAAFLAMRGSVGMAAYLWAPHNEHHLVLIRLLTALDVTAFGASSVPFVTAATAALLAAAGIAHGAMRRAAGPALAWLGPMLLLTAAAAADCSTPIYAVYPLVLVFTMTGVALFDGAAERTAATPARRVAAIAAAALAGFANAVGLLAWPVLLWAAWHGRAGARWLAAVAASALLYCYIYLHSLSAAEPGMTVAAVLVPPHLARMAAYLVAYLGLPVTVGHALRLSGQVLGLLVLLAGLTAVICLGWRRGGSRTDRFGVALILFTLGSALSAALGRADVDAMLGPPGRYVVLVAPAHLGLLLLLVPRLGRRAAGRPSRVRALGAGMALAGVLLLLQVGVGRAAIVTADGWRATLAAFYAGRAGPGMVPVVYSDLPTARRMLAAMRAAGLGW